MGGYLPEEAVVEPPQRLARPRRGPKNAREHARRLFVVPRRAILGETPDSPCVGGEHRVQEPCIEQALHVVPVERHLAVRPFTYLMIEIHLRHLEMTAA